MLKVIGALLIIFAFGIAGMEVSRKYREYPNHLRLIRSGLQMLETEIVYTATPMPEALQIIGNRVENPCGLLFSSAAKAMKKEQLGICDAWEKGLQELQERSQLQKIDLDILRIFGQGLGMSGSEEQVKNLKLVQEQLKSQESRAREKRDAGEKLWKALGFLLGLATVLVLY